MRLKVFCLYARGYYIHKHSAVRRQVIEAVLRRRDVLGLVSGPGWDYYDESKTLQENIDKLLPNADVCWIYKPDGSPKLGIAPVIGAENVKALKVVRMHECWWDGKSVTKAMRAKDVLNGKADLVVHCHANDAERLAELGVKAVHIPQTADPAIFRCDTPIKDRPIDCLITGSVSAEHYPLRVRLRNLIRSKAIPGVELPHPGYWLSESDNAKQLANYAAHLGKSKIVLCCSSKWRYWLGKTVEAAQSGCVVACDTPDDSMFEKMLGQDVLRLNPGWDDDELAGVLNRWLRHPELQQMASAGQQVACSALNHDVYATLFVQAVREALKGRQ